MKNRISGVYQLVFRDKIYIGSSVNMWRRWNEHRRHLRNNVHDNKYLQNIYNKYGLDEFIFKIVEVIEDKEARLKREQYWLDYVFNNVDTANLLNLSKSSTGNAGGATRKADHIEKVRQANIGKKRSDAFKQRMHEVKIGKPLTAEHRENIRRAVTGRVYGDETRAKLRAIQKKRYSRNYAVVSPDGTIYEFQMITDFANDLGLNRRGFNDLLLNNVKSYKGWTKL